MKMNNECPYCLGTGVSIIGLCFFCNGTGEIDEDD